MTDNELLSAMSDILKLELQPIRNEMQEIRNEMQGMRNEMQDMKNDIDFLTENSQKHDAEFSKLSQEIKGVNLHLENFTDKKISILAENHLNLIDKLNQAVKTSDKNLIYEIKINYLTEKV